MSSPSEFVVIRDLRSIKPHPLLVGADGYHQCAACPVGAGNDLHCITRNAKVYVRIHDAALSTPRMLVEHSLVVECNTGDELAAAVRAQASPRAVAS
jgi:hypothetical protein